MTPREQVVPIRGGAVRFRVLTAGSGPDLVWFHSFHDRSAWPPVLDRLAQRFTVHAPFHPGVQGSDGVEAVDDVVDLALAYDELMGALGRTLNVQEYASRATVGRRLASGPF